MSKLKDYWNEVYSYEKNIVIHRWRQDLIYSIVRDNLDKIDSILEIGCCSGSNLLPIRELSSKISIFGMDINKKAIEYGKKQSAGIKFIAGDIRDLSMFSSGSFDLVFSAGVLMYFDRKIASGILMELVRISKKFIINLERNGKDKVLSSINMPSYKIVMFETNYLKRYKKLGLRARGYYLGDHLKNASKKDLKNVRDLIYASKTDEELKIF